MQRYHDDGCDCGIMLRLHVRKWDYEKWDEEIHFKRRRTERDTGKNICYNIYDIDEPDFKIRNAQSLFFELIEIDGNHSEYPQSLLEKLMEFLKKLFGAAKKINAQRFRIINNAHFELVKLLEHVEADIVEFASLDLEESEDRMPTIEFNHDGERVYKSWTLEEFGNLLNSIKAKEQTKIEFNLEVNGRYSSIEFLDVFNGVNSHGCYIILNFYQIYLEIEEDFCEKLFEKYLTEEDPEKLIGSYKFDTSSRSIYRFPLSYVHMFENAFNYVKKLKIKPIYEKVAKRISQNFEVRHTQKFSSIITFEYGEDIPINKIEKENMIDSVLGVVFKIDLL
uniref:Uncharacterized protein n=1 Tax=Acrobeloides nanus TaxID=290746 RepID=A0A914DZK5_9BILA